MHNESLKVETALQTGVFPCPVIVAELSESLLQAYLAASAENDAGERQQ